MTGAVGLPDDPEEPPLETEDVGETPTAVPPNQPAAEPTDDDEDSAAGRS